MISEVPASCCPICGEPFECATGIDCERAPLPGDVAMCPACGTFNLYADDLTLRLPTIAEAMVMVVDPRLIALRQAHTALTRKH